MTAAFSSAVDPSCQGTGGRGHLRWKIILKTFLGIQNQNPVDLNAFFHLQGTCFDVLVQNINLLRENKLKIKADTTINI